MTIANLYDSQKNNADFVFNHNPAYVSFEYINYSNTVEELDSIKFLSKFADEVYIDPAWVNYQDSNSRVKSTILGKVSVDKIDILTQAYTKLA